MKTIFKEKPLDKSTQEFQSNYPSAFKHRIYSVLETYANVHRGSGQKSLITTRLYEHARILISDYMQLDSRKHILIFATAYSAEIVKQQAKNAVYKEINTDITGLLLGVNAIALSKPKLKNNVPAFAGGGTARLTAPGWVLWEKMPELFEAGTPAVVNIVAFAVALQMQEKHGTDIFRSTLSSCGEKENVNHEYSDLHGEQLLEQLIDEMPGKNFSIPGKKGALPYVNLDSSASTPALYPTFEAWFNSLQANNPAQQKIINQAEKICASFLNAPNSEYKVLFTANTTEAINLAAQIINKKVAPDEITTILTSMLEHSSNDLPWRLQPNIKILRLNGNNLGFISPAEVEQKLKTHPGKDKIAWIAITGASNVLGSVTNIREIARLAHSYGAKLLVDGAQLVPHQPVDMAAWGIDALAFSGHKMYAPFGSGALIIRRDVLSTFADMPHPTKNIAGIAALAKSMQLLQRVGMDLIHEKEQKLTEYLLNKMQGINGVKLYGITDLQHGGFAHRLGVLAFEAGGKMPFKTGNALAANGVGVRVGCHCAHIAVKKILGISPWQEKLQKVILQIIPKLKLQGVARISLGIENKKQDIQRAVDAIRNHLEKEKTQDSLSPGMCKKRDEALVQKSIETVYG